MEAIYAFFAGYTPEVLVGMAAMALVFMFKGAGVKLMNYLKNKLGLSAERANLFIVAFLMLFSFAALVVTGYFKETEPITLAKVIAVGSICYTLSQVAYKRLFPKQPPPVSGSPNGDNQEGP